MTANKKSKVSLYDHIEKLRAAEAANPTKSVGKEAILFWGTGYDKEYLPYLKGTMRNFTTFLRADPVTTISQVQLYCHTKHITRVISTSLTLLKKLLCWDKRKAPSLANYAGSHFKIKTYDYDTSGEYIEIVFIQPLKHMVTVPYGKFMTERTIGKLTRPNDWYEPTPFTGFDMLTASNEESLHRLFSGCFLICIDIETFKENATIRCLSYTGFYYNQLSCEGEHLREGIQSTSVVLPMDSEYNLSIMRKWNLLPAPKVMQNGKYDISYLARYNAPVVNYLYDTAHLFHSWYSELPKDLGFLNAFFLREATYWKDLAETNDLHEYYRYNALDTWGTGNVWLAMLLEAPEYAIQNYLLELPLIFPCHLAEMTGIERDMDKFAIARDMQQEIVDKYSAQLNTILGIPEGQTFNVKSPKQVRAVLDMLGCKDIKSGDEKSLKKARFRHPFNARIINLILRIRKARTLISNYLTAGKEFSRLDGTGNRFLFSLNPHGTDTGRLASKSHHFWCGDNVQKIPRPDPDSGIPYSIVKTTFKADPDFLLFEVDLEQAESRDTAYISGDTTLIHNVEHSPDFHCANASAFFGIPFEELYDVALSKKLNTKIRDIAKNVNHGANYNMGAFVLVETMGEENIVKAKSLLGLPLGWGYIRVAEYLLEQFHITYPAIKQTFYAGVIDEIGLKHKLISQAMHYCTNEDHYNTMVDAGVGTWVRRCFSDPSKSKPALNAYIAHPPQNLNAMTLNRAWWDVFTTIAMSPKHAPNFKLNAQVHDSILGQHRIGHEYLKDMVKEKMEIPVTIKGYDEVIRTFTVPADKSNSGTHWSDLK